MSELTAVKVVAGHLAAMVLLALAARELRVRAALRRPPSPALLPSAQETSDSVLRFQEAVRRDALVDFVWERWLRNRALFYR